MKTYKISYKHRTTETSTSISRARCMVADELKRLSRWDGICHIAHAADGEYCYATRADKDADGTGTRAFAVIESPAQQEAAP